jgi:hypothetical protein
MEAIFLPHPRLKEIAQFLKKIGRKPTTLKLGPSKHQPPHLSTTKPTGAHPFKPTHETKRPHEE